MFRGRDDAAFRGAAGPGVSDLPRLEMDVTEAVLPKLLGGPIVRRFELRRTGEARANVVGNEFEILCGFAVIVDLSEYSCVGGRKRRSIVRHRR